MTVHDTSGAPDPSPSEARMQGFPPEPSTLVTLANWQDAPNQRWAFQHMRELIPTHPIAATHTRPPTPRD